MTGLIIIAVVCICLGWAVQRFGRRFGPATTSPRKRALLAASIFVALIVIMVVMALLLVQRRG